MIEFRIFGWSDWILVPMAGWSFQQCIRCIPEADWRWINDGRFRPHQAMLGSRKEVWWCRWRSIRA
jgi:hypothetical protein